MNNQKDIQNTTTNSYGHSENNTQNMLTNKPVYESVNKKTEKLVTALYMVTDCMDTEDALKAKLRFLGVELLSDIYKLSTLAPMDKSNQSSLSLVRINELLSCVSIATTIGYISEMNSTILHREFKKLTADLDSYLSKDSHFTFTLSDSLFETEQNKDEPLAPHYPIKDNVSYKGQQVKKTFPLPHFTNRLQASVSPKGQVRDASRALPKEDRSEKILVMIKDKKNIAGYLDGVSIKDISSAFTDRSEKTIQRELNALVSKGQIKKIGAKRWSRYQAL